MSTFTRGNTEIAVDIEGLGRQHRAEAGGMVVISSTAAGRPWVMLSSPDVTTARS